MTLESATKIAQALLRCGYSDALRGETLFYLNSSDLPFVWVQTRCGIDIYASEDRRAPIITPFDLSELMWKK